MIDPIIFDKVDDNYVKCPLGCFVFLKETGQTGKPVLELMCTETPIIQPLNE